MTTSEKRYDRAVHFEFNYLLTMRLEDIPKIMSSVGSSRYFERKFAYLTQYIDFEEAKRMNMSILPIFESDGTDGYEFESKLDSLNYSAERIISKFLGLHGEEPKAIKTISNEFGIHQQVVKDIINILLPLMLKPLGDFRNKIGYNEERQVDGSSKEYTNKQYRPLDIKAETQYILKNLLSESDRESILQIFKKQEWIAMYIARKFMYTSAEQTARNFSLTAADVEEITDERRYQL